MLNKAILMGRLTRDPELKYTQSNLPVVQFTVAVERNRSAHGQEKQTDFINIVAWRKTAEFVSQWFTKGMMIIVEGAIQSRSWQDKDGNNRTTIEVVASAVQFGETKKSRESNTGYQGGYSDTYAPAPQQASRPAPSFDMPAGNSDFSEIYDDDGEVPF